MAHESSKSQRRRAKEDAAGILPWSEIFQGKILDIGAGDDPLKLPDCTPFDTADGDANKLTNYFDPESFDLLHASHLVEHLYNPKQSLRDWVDLLKPGGYLLFTVPDVGAYEDFKFPSVKNPDHKASFSMIYRGSAFPIHYHIPTLLHELSDIYETLVARYIEINFDWSKRHVDQTWKEEDGVEIWNEVLLQKKP